MNKGLNKIFTRIAKTNNTTIENVRDEIASAIEYARNNSYPIARMFWENFTSKNETPSPEEVILRLSDDLKNDDCFLS